MAQKSGKSNRSIKLTKTKIFCKIKTEKYL